MVQTDRRKFLTTAAAVPAALTLSASALSKSAIASESRKSICLVHGAWHGGWAWKRLVPFLEAAGYHVTYPDLSGLGANSHRQSPDIGLHVHGQDLLNHLYFNDITDAVVVAHSYGGCVLSEALAADDDKRITHAVYLDALVPEEGQGLSTFVPPEIRENFEKAADKEGMIPPRPPEMWEKIWGLTGEAAEFAGPRLRPMSARCFTETVQGNPFNTNAKLTYLRCVQNPNKLFDKFATMVKDDDRFNYGEIDGHHDVMVTDPKLTWDSLQQIL